MLAVVHVNFRTHAERLEIQTRLNSKPGAWDQPPIVMTLVIVHVDAVAVHVAPEVMSGTMQNPFPEPGAFEHFPRRPVDLPPAQIPLITG